MLSGLISIPPSLSYFFLARELAGMQIARAASSSSRLKMEAQLMVTPERRMKAPLSFFWLKFGSDSDLEDKKSKKINKYDSFTFKQNTHMQVPAHPHPHTDTHTPSSVLHFSLFTAVVKCVC